MINQVAHPMVKFQRKLASLVESKVIQPSDRLWKIAFLFGQEWEFWKKELQEFGFTMKDPIDAVLIVESWDEED
ncbi:MAG: DUF4327 family protein [Microcystaceae cyanobacterium]